MANYHLRMVYGKVGKGVPHINYIMGQDKYDYKEDEILYDNHNMPDWVNSPKDFWETADSKERVNGVVYKEIRISLPNELSDSENIELLNDFVNKELGDNHYYSAVIHNKEANEFTGKHENIHAHIMFCTRKVDEIERTKETFFKRSNSKHHEKGGCAKDKNWDDKERLFDIRKSWENIQNKALENNNINTRVSCETLKKQREVALSNNDFEKASLLDREPISINGYLLKKDENKLNDNQKIEFEKFKLNRKIRDIKEEIYFEKLSQNKIKDNVIKIEKLDENIVTNNQVDPQLNALYDAYNSLQMINFEIYKNDYLLKSDLNDLALRELSLDYSNLKNDYNILSATGTQEELYKIQKNMDEIISQIPKDSILAKEIEIEQSLQKKAQNLSISRECFISQLNKENPALMSDSNSEKINKLFEKTFSNNLEMSLNSSNKISMMELNLEKNLKQQKDTENIAKNILSKGDFSKINKEYQDNLDKAFYLSANIEHNTFSLKDKTLAQNKLNSIYEKNIILKSKIDAMNKDFATPEMKNKTIRISESIMKKLKEQEKTYLKDINIETMSKNILFEKMVNTDLTRSIVKNEISKLYTENQNSNSKILKYNKIKENLTLDSKKLERLAYNKLTGGTYNKILNSYNKNTDEITKLKEEVSSLSTSLMSKIANRSKLQELNTKINNLEKESVVIETNFRNLRSNIPDEKLFTEINNLKDIFEKSKTKINELEKPIKNKIYLNNKKIKEANKILETLSKDKFREKIQKVNIPIEELLRKGNSRSYGTGQIDFDSEERKRNDFSLGF